MEHDGRVDGTWMANTKSIKNPPNFNRSSLNSEKDGEIPEPETFNSK